MQFSLVAVWRAEQKQEETWEACLHMLSMGFGKVQAICKYQFSWKKIDSERSCIWWRVGQNRQILAGKTVGIQLCSLNLSLAQDSKKLHFPPWGVMAVLGLKLNKWCTLIILICFYCIEMTVDLFNSFIFWVCTVCNSTVPVKEYPLQGGSLLSYIILFQLDH